MSVLAEVAKAIVDMPRASVLLVIDPPLTIIDAHVRPPEQLAVVFTLPDDEGRRGGTFEYLQSDMRGLLADVSTRRDAADGVAAVVVANLREALEARDMGLDWAMQEGVVRRVDVDSL